VSFAGGGRSELFERAKPWSLEHVVPDFFHRDAPVTDFEKLMSSFL